MYIYCTLTHAYIFKAEYKDISKQHGIKTHSCLIAASAHVKTRFYHFLCVFVKWEKLK